MAYPFRPVKVPVVVQESEIRRSKRKTDLFSDTKRPFRDTPTRLRKKLFSSPPR
ncbi:hypothetical protein ES703_111141 [subsurface metagenome]